MLRTLICDDESAARQRIGTMLTRYPDIEIIGEAANGEDALAQCETLLPDLIFLDIDMPVLNGLEVAANLRDLPIKTVFLTAYSEHAVAAFEHMAVDYLVKPVAQDRLSQTIERLRSLPPTPPPVNAKAEKPPIELGRLAFKSGTGYRMVDHRNVSAILASNQYAEVYFAQEKLLIEESLERLTQRLEFATSPFLRIHRSAIVNINYVERLQRKGDRRYVAHLGDHYRLEIPIARERLQLAKQRMGL